jgi:O-antigen ligase
MSSAIPSLTTRHHALQRGGDMALIAAGYIALAWLIASLPLPFTAILLAAGSAGIALIRWPWLIWPAIALALPVASGFRLGPITATEVLLAAGLLLWLAEGAHNRRLWIYYSPLLAPLLVLIGVLLLSSLRARDLGEAVAEVVKWVEFAAVIAVAPVAVPRRAVRWLAAALVAAGVVQALLGLYQFVFAIGPEWFVLFDRFMRASGVFRQPNPFAGYLGLSLPLAASLALWAWGCVIRGDNAEKACIFWASYYSGASVIIVAALLASWSRGGWLGALAGLAIVFVLRSRASFVWSSAAAVFAAVAGLLGMFNPSLVPAGIQDRLLSLPESFRIETALSQTVTDENFAVIERLAHWVAALRMWEQAPWLGVGPGNYAVAYQAVRLPLWEEALGHAHNLYLNTLAEAGLIGLTAFVVLWIAFIVWVWNKRGQPGDWQTAASLGVLGALAHAAVHNVVDNIFVQGNYLHLALSIALLAAVCNEAGRSRASSRRS